MHDGHPLAKDFSLAYVCKTIFYKHIFGVLQAVLPAYLTLAILI